jgi:ketosteroid isomerase-like protein
MSQENVEALRRAFDASSAVGYDLSPYFDLYSEEVELYVSRSAAETGVWRGSEAVKRYWRDIVATWGRVRQEPRELIDLDDRVLAVIHIRAWNRQSDIALDQEVAVIYSFADRKIVRLEYYFSGREEALEAVGLPE